MKYLWILIMLMILPGIEGVGYVPTSVHGLVTGTEDVIINMTAYKHGTETVLYIAEPINLFPGGEFVQTTTTDPADGPVDLLLTVKNKVTGETLTASFYEVPPFSMAEANFSFVTTLPSKDKPVSDESSSAGSSGGGIIAGTTSSGSVDLGPVGVTDYPSSDLEDEFVKNAEEGIKKSIEEDTIDPGLIDKFEIYSKEKRKILEHAEPINHEESRFIDYAIIVMIILIIVVILSIVFMKKNEKSHIQP